MITNYRVNGRDHYQIDFRPQPNGTIKLFALQHPADSHGAAVSENHLFLTGEVCVAAGHEPRSMDRAKAIAVHWMEGYSEYVRTGKFPNGARRVTV
jgi:hypothetical protein